VRPRGAAWAPAAAALAAGLASGPARAAAFDGAGLSPAWGVPFAGLLLSIALLPLAAPAFWHRHFGKVAAGWASLFFLPFAATYGMQAAIAQLAHAVVAEYLPFILLLAALFTVAGGIHVRGNLRGSPGLNTGLLGLGTALASVMGTTGAAMLLLRPLIRANDDRPRRTHVVVFFIFLVCNVGGALTPLGDPPLFLGFLKGVEFSWTLRHILPHTLFVVGTLLAGFYLLDRWHFRREGLLRRDPTPDTSGIGIEGGANFLLLAGIVGLVLMSGIWKSPVAFDVLGTPVGLPGLVRDLGMAAIALASLRITPRSVHVANQFGWGPMAEVAKLFAGIFLTIVPVIAMLRAGADGPFGAVVAAVIRPDGQPDPAMYFWATGLLSAFLDNAPTYLVFFNTAGGDPAALMTALAPTLAAISAGAVFMGAVTYIGNAPNLMVKAIAEERGVPMPGFFGFMAWSCAILLPLFLAVTLLWFR
jgi:Na+/H+ antiporter NhaD/arsenite permease-like protein